MKNIKVLTLLISTKYRKTFRKHHKVSSVPKGHKRFQPVATKHDTEANAGKSVQ